MQSKLLRIIFIDSFTKGRISEVLLDGHTIIQGDNRVGKSTLLYLVPLFYGESILNSTRGSDNFADYYFAGKKSSYIIFEYLRNGEKKMLVLNKGSADKETSFRLIDAGYEDALFSDASGKVISSDNLKMHISTHTAGHVDVTRMLDHSEYALIIQGAVPRHNSIHKKDLFELSSRFSLTNMPAKGIHRLMTGILKKVNDYDTLKGLLVNSISDENSLITLSDVDSKKFNTWKNGFIIHQKLGSKRSVLDDAMVSHGKKVSIRNSIEDIFNSVDAHLTYLSGEIEKNQTENKSIIQEMESQENEYRTQKSGMNMNLSNIKGRLQTLNVELGSLKKSIEFDPKRIELAALNAGMVDHLHEASIKAKEDLEHHNASKDAGNIDMMNKDLLKISEEKSAELEANQNAYQSRVESNEIEFKNVIERLQTSHEKNIQFSDAELNELSLKSIALDDRAQLVTEKMVDIQPDQSLIDQKADIVKNVEQVKDLIKSIESKKVDQQASLNNIKSSIKENNALIDKNSGVINGYLEKIQSLNEKITPKPGTLLHYLEANNPEWHSNIGLVIDDSLLSRDDLKPSMNEGDSLYGLNIDVSVIDKKSDIDQMKAQVEVFSKEVAKITGEINALTQNNSQLNAEAVDTENGLLIISNELIKNNNLLKSLQSQLLNIIDDINKNLADLKKDLLAEFSKIKLEKDSIKSNTLLINNRKSEELKSFNAESMSLNKAFEAKKSQNKLNNDQIRKEISDTFSQREKLVRDMYAEKDNIFANKLKMLNDVWKQAFDAYQKAKSDKEFIDGYHAKLAVYNDKAPGIIESIDDLDKQSSTLDRDIKKVDMDFSTSRKLLEDALNAVSVKSKELSMRNSEALKVRDSLQSKYLFESIPNQTPQRDIDIHHLIKEIKSLSEQFEIESKKVASAKDDISRAFENTDAHMSVLMLIEQIKDSGQSSGDDAFFKAYQTWYEHEYVQKLNLHMTAFHSYMMSIRQFNKRLSDFKSSVTKFNNSVQESMSRLNGKFNVVSNIQIDIKTKFDEMLFINSINAMDNQYTLWTARKSDGDVVPDEFIKTMSNLIASISSEGSAISPRESISIEVNALMDGVQRKARNGSEFRNMNSTGSEVLILSFILVAFFNTIRKDANMVIHWPVDELGTLTDANSRLLLEFLHDNQIIMVSALPGDKEVIKQMCKNKLTINSDRTISVEESVETEEEYYA